jgi:hypothetical protein
MNSGKDIALGGDVASAEYRTRIAEAKLKIAVEALETVKNTLDYGETGILDAIRIKTADALRKLNSHEAGAKDE